MPHYAKSKIQKCADDNFKKESATNPRENCGKKNRQASQSVAARLILGSCNIGCAIITSLRLLTSVNTQVMIQVQKLDMDVPRRPESVVQGD